MSANEWKAACEHKKSYCVYIVTNAFKEQPKIEVIRDPVAYVEDGKLRLEIASVLVGLVPQKDKDSSPELKLLQSSIL